MNIVGCFDNVVELLDNIAILIHGVNLDIAFRMKTDLAPFEITRIKR
jgi:hypothetical protein